MAKVISWKLDSYKYGYLYIPGVSGSNQTHITNRITNQEALSSMVSHVSSWDFATYETAFNNLNDEITRKYGTPIEGSASDYYYSSGQTYVILTGKDGENAKNCDISDEMLEKIDGVVSKRVNVAIASMSSTTSTMQSWVSDKVNYILSSSQSAICASTISLEDCKTVFSAQVSTAVESMNHLADLFDLADSEIDADKIKTMYKNSTSNNEWVVANSGIFKTIKDDYILADTSISSIKTGVNALSGKTRQIDLKINEENSKIQSLSATVKSIEERQKSGSTISEEAFISVSAKTFDVDNKINSLSGATQDVIKIHESSIANLEEIVDGLSSDLNMIFKQAEDKPQSSSSSGKKGECYVDAEKQVFYLCVSDNMWLKIAMQRF